MLQTACTIRVSSFDLSKSITFSGIFSKIKLSPSARLVLRCLIDFWNPEKGLVFPGQRKLAEYTGVKLRSVNSAVNELRKENLIFTAGAAGEKLKYSFTTKFFELTKVAQGNAKIAQEVSANIAYHEQKKPEQNTKQINTITILSNGFKIKTDFQKEYIDIFEKLTTKQIEKYKLLEGFEREKWLIKKRQEFRKVEKNSINIMQIAELSELIEFKDRKKGLKHCASAFKLNPRIISNNSLAHKIAEHWGFTDQDFRNYLLYGDI